MNQLIKLLFIIFLVFNTTSCSNEEENISPIECIGDIQQSFTASTCEEVNTNSIWCEIHSIGQFELLDGSKDFMSDVCNNIGDNIVFENLEGDQILFEINDFKYNEGIVTYRSNNICDPDSINPQGICLIRDIVILELISDNPVLKFTIELMVKPDLGPGNIGGIGDFLVINRFIDSNSFISELNVVLNQRTLSFSSGFGQEFHETVNILNQDFNDVFSRDISTASENQFDYYFNKEFGWIAFEDENGVIWKKI